VRFFGGKKEYTMADGENKYVFQSDEGIPQGSCVEVQGEIRGERIEPTLVIVLEGEQAEDAIRQVKEKAAAQVKEGPLILKDEVTTRMWPSIRKAAAEILYSRKAGRPILLRFHGDADGVCGASALAEVMYCKTYQQNAAVYSVRDALRDIGNVGQDAKPLIILLDFASNDASAPGLELLRAAGIQFMIIDHHPPGQKMPEQTVSPFSYTEDGSKYTAGYLGCEIAAACGMDIVKATELAKVACAGDKSQILDSGEKEVEKARVLDFLAAHASFGNSLDFYRKVMGKEELYNSISLQARESIDEAASRVSVKKSAQDGLIVASFSLDNIVKKGEWPPAGKITTSIFESMSGQEPLLCIGYTERSVIMRLNDGAAAAGLSANELAKKTVASMADFVEGGGGHAKAGAIRVKKGFAREVLNEIVRQAIDVIKQREQQK
jgi:RecJ-like exonuclease